MKKFLIVLSVFFLSAFSSIEVYADDSAEVQALTESQQSAEVSSGQASSARSTIQSELERLEEERSELSDENDPDGSKRRELDSKIGNQTTNLQIARIEESSKQLIATNRAKAIDIQKNIEACGNCERIEILKMQQSANAAYDAYLVAKRDLDICRVENCNNLERYESNTEEKANAVRTIISDLTQIETTRNTLRTFDVSGVFTLPGQNVSDRTIQGVVDTVANWMIILASSLAVTALIIGGFMMIISGGDENRLELGKTIFTYSLMGLFVTLMAFGIVTFLQSLFY